MKLLVAAERYLCFALFPAVGIMFMPNQSYFVLSVLTQKSKYKTTTDIVFRDLHQLPRWAPHNLVHSLKRSFRRRF